MKNMKKIIFPVLIVILSIVGIVIYEQGQKKNISMIERVAEKVEVSNEKIVVQVEGAVKNVGVFEVTKNMHLYELLLLVEPLPEADLQKFNLAEILKDGQCFKVPPRKQEVENATRIINLDVTRIVNVNSAGVDELALLPGIGPSYARNIVDYRNVSGFFKTKKDLLKVKGIGPIRLKKMEQFITLD